MASIETLASEGDTKKKNEDLRHYHEEAPSHSSDYEAKETVEISVGELEIYKTYLGRVDVNPNRSSHLNPRYPGVVRSVGKSVGDEVKAGEVLARIDSNVGVQTYSLNANISGKIIHRKLAVGEFVNEDRLAFTITDLEQLWVNITVRQRDLKFLKKEQQVIIVSRDNLHHTVGDIFYISPVVDQHTMTATATVEIKNTGDLWKPGQYVDCFIIVEKRKSNLTVPNQSVVTKDKNNYLVAINKDGKPEKKLVQVVQKDLHHSEILGDFRVGDQVMANPEDTMVHDKHEHGENEEDDHRDHDEQKGDHMEADESK